jgi:hypothetical protein
VNEENIQQFQVGNIGGARTSKRIKQCPRFEACGVHLADNGMRDGLEGIGSTARRAWT